MDKTSNIVSLETSNLLEKLFYCITKHFLDIHKYVVNNLSVQEFTCILQVSVV